MLSGGALAFGSIATATSAQTRPSIARIVVGIPPGGPGDLLARTLAERMRESYAPTMLVENKPGAATQLAITAVRNAPADGSQLLLTPSSPLSLYPYTFKQLPYKPEEDFTSVASLGSANHAFAIGPLVPANVRSLADYLAWAKVHPDLASFGSPASGSIPHLQGIAIGHFGDTRLTHVPYKGSTPGVQDMLGGQIGAMSSPLGFFLPLVGGGKVRVLAVSGEQRSRFLPEVPTLREQGIPLTAREWYGMFMPSKTPTSLIKAASDAITAALADGTVATTMSKFGFEIEAGSGATLAKMLRADTQEWGTVVKRIGFTAES